MTGEGAMEMRMRSMMRSLSGAAALAALIGAAGCEKPAAPAKKVELAPATKKIRFGVGICDKANPLDAGVTAAKAAKKAIGAAPVKAVIISECFEDKERKEQVLEGVTSVFDAEVVYGGATYGSFAQAGVMIDESVAVMAIAGDDIDVAAACLEGLGTAKLTPAEHEAEIREKLVPAGADLAKKLPATDASRLMIVIADAHSPKNGPLVEGVRSVAGDGFPIIGGSANKNAGQTFVYYKGKMLADAAVGLMLSGDFKVALAGRSAKDNAAVIATAREAAAEALGKLAEEGAKPAGILAFDCAGRKGKLDNVADELAAIQDSVGSEVPLFGSYNAGEVGPADVAEKEPGVLSSGMGWHIMVGAIGW
jgi:hypothetical protein